MFNLFCLLQVKVEAEQDLRLHRVANSHVPKLFSITY